MAKIKLPTGGTKRPPYSGGGGVKKPPPKPPTGKPPVQPPPATIGAGDVKSGGIGGFLSGNTGKIALGAGIGILGSQLLGGKDTALGGALDNVSEGVGDAVGSIGAGVGNLASGTGSAVGSIGAGAGSGIASIGGGLGSFTAVLPYVALGGGALLLVFMLKK